MPDARSLGAAVYRELLPNALPESEDAELRDGDFADGFGELALENVFGRLWARPGLDRRARSLLTLGILIGLRASDELQVHFGIAVRNGLTREELEEVIYHASGYAGFPAAAEARRAATRAFAASDNDTSR